MGETVVHCEHFEVDRWMLHEARGANENHRFAVFQCVTGEVLFGDRKFRAGDLFLVPASAHREKLKPATKSSVVLRTTIGE